MSRAWPLLVFIVILAVIVIALDVMGVTWQQVSAGIALAMAGLVAVQRK